MTHSVLPIPETREYGPGLIPAGATWPPVGRHCTPGFAEKCGTAKCYGPCVEPVSAKELKYLYGAYLEHCCRYYVLDAPVISDEDFDHLCRVLCEGWDRFSHRYKHLTNREALSAGTGFHIAPNEYPLALIELCRAYPDRALTSVFPEE